MKNPGVSAIAQRRWHPRAIFIALALGTIAAGLAVHWRGSALSPVMRDVLGDLLWASMVYWWIGALTPRTRQIRRGSATLALGVTVELSQLYHTPALDSFRGTRVGHLFLGSGFDPRDLVAYTLGVAVAVLGEAWVAALRRKRG